MSRIRRVVAAVGVLAGCGGGAATTDPTGTSPVASPVTSAAATDPTVPPSTTSTTATTATTPGTTTPGPLPAAALSEPIAVFDEPLEVIAPPGADETWVVERAGRVRGLDGTVHLDVSADVVPAVEEGVLGAAFSPDGTHLYLNVASEGRTRIVAHPVAADGTVSPSGLEVYAFDQPYENHNGGDLMFGPSGHLYVFSGDGGFVGDPERRGLDLTTPKGKVLRIAPRPGEDPPFVAPPDNPFVADPDALDEIWSYGLRNPWRASFDPETGDLWIADVGDFDREVVNVGWADEGAGRGVSFGWSAWEGTLRFNEDQPAEGHEFPFFEYEHGSGDCSISGGERYRGDAVPELVGWYVFADFCSGAVRAVEVLDDRSPGRVVDVGEVPAPVTVRAAPDGELVVVSIVGGLHRVVPG